jgi:hypothetical protein
MRIRVPVVLASCLALLLGASMWAAPRQEPVGTRRPGEPTKGKVWIENRSPDDAIPVVVLDSEPLPVRTAGQAWEYQTVTIPRAVTPRDLTIILNAQGIIGWETTGVQVTTESTTLVVMKRPRREVR